jgi:ferric-dicitrate binding protein FerR (iron transport regulator)
METNWELIAKCLSGEASQEEQDLLANWRSQDIENEKTYQEMYQIWHSKKQSNDVFDSHAAFKKLTHRIQSESSLTVSHKSAQSSDKKAIIFKKYYQFAAAVVGIMLIATGIWWRVNQSLPAQNQTIIAKKIEIIEKVNPKGQKLQLRLPDNSRVWLNSESKISYPSHFEGDKREIVLEGEAFFEVAHNPQKPFVIKTPNAKVQVLGTSFNVRAYSDEKNIETVVVTGKVKMTESSQEENFTELTPNEKGTLSLQNSKIDKKKVKAEDYIAWKDGVLKFKNESLSQIIKQLERWYGVTITITNPIVLDCHLTGDFKNESLETILIYMEKAIGIQFEINQKEIKIKGRGCK